MTPNPCVERSRAERKVNKAMRNSLHSDPAERSALLRLFYRDWRPTRVGRWVNRLASWWSALGMTSTEMAVLEVPGRTSGRRRSTPVVVATVEGKTLPRYRCSAPTLIG